MGWVVSSNRLACMIIQAKVITIHLVEQKGILRVKIFFSCKHTFVCRKAGAQLNTSIPRFPRFQLQRFLIYRGL